METQSERKRGTDRGVGREAQAYRKRESGRGRDTGRRGEGRKGEG
jgi:hypothetical protein